MMTEGIVATSTMATAIERRGRELVAIGVDDVLEFELLGAGDVGLLVLQHHLHLLDRRARERVVGRLREAHLEERRLPGEVGVLEPARPELLGNREVLGVIDPRDLLDALDLLDSLGERRDIGLGGPFDDDLRRVGEREVVVEDREALGGVELRGQIRQQIVVDRRVHESERGDDQQQDRHGENRLATLHDRVRETL